MKRIFLLIIPILLFSCEEEAPKIPTDIIPEEKMTTIFKEILLLESQVEHFKFGRDTAQQVYEEMENEIWAKNEVTEARFKKSHRYYLENLEGYENIYKALIDTFGVMESKKESGMKLTKDSKKKK